MEPTCVSRMYLGSEELTRCKGLRFCHTEKWDALEGWLCVIPLHPYWPRWKTGPTGLMEKRPNVSSRVTSPTTLGAGSDSIVTKGWALVLCCSVSFVNWMPRVHCVVWLHVFLPDIRLFHSIPAMFCRWIVVSRFCGIIDVYCSVGWQGRLNGKTKSYCIVQFHWHALLPTLL